MIVSQKFKGFLFDFDGVLADTMEDHFRAWNHALGVYQTAIAAQDFFPLEGMPVSIMAREICVKAGVDRAHASELLQTKDAHYLQHYRRATFYPSVEEIIDKLFIKKIPMAIVSGGRYARIAASTPAAFLEKFSAVVTGEKTPRGKPYPDPYLDGARLLNLEPSQCIVVENAPLGIQAAHAAGAYCIAIASTVEKKILADADEIIEKFSQFSSLSIVQELLRAY